MSDPRFERFWKAIAFGSLARGGDITPVWAPDGRSSRSSKAHRKTRR